MRIRMEDGREFNGTSVQIVQAMKSIAFGHDDDTLGQYVDWVQRQTAEYMGITLDIKGASAEEKADSLVQELLRTGLADRV